MPRPREPEADSIPGLELIDRIGRGARTVVYRARRGRRTVAVKMPLGSSDSESSEAIRLAFRREAAWLACLDHPAVPPILEIGETAGGRPYVVTSFAEGPTLTELIRRGAQLESVVIGLGRAVADALVAVHARGLVHRDVKPDNLVIGPGLKVTLLDFGLAMTEVDEEPPSGNLLYAAPEQLGLIPRPVDPRADLFALGAVLFHAATGRPPFRAAHPGALRRQRAEEETIPIGEVNGRLSPAFAAIVDRLLARDPDQRYQTSQGLLTDLESIDILNQQLRRGQAIRLDAAGPTLHGYHPLPLLGRDQALQGLLDAWSEAGRRRGSFHLVEGASGTGKTRLVLELSVAARRAGGTVLMAQSIHGDDAPHHALRRAVERWLSEVTRNGARDEARRILAEVAADLKTPLVRVAPALAELLPPSAAPSPEPGRKQIESAIAEFILRLAERVGPLLLIIDDAQWVSPATLRVLARLMPRIADASLLVVLGYRPSDVQRRPLVGFLQRLRAHAPGRTRLGALDESVAGEFCRRMLGGCTISDALLERVLRASGRNPLAMREHIRMLVETGVLLPTDLPADRPEGGEAFALERDLNETLKRRLSLLSELTREILGPAALFGGGFSVEVLARTTGRPAADVNRALAEAIGSALITASPPGRYTFTHNRIRRAVAELVEDRLRPDVHRRIAVALEAARDSDPASLCTVAQQYALAGLDQVPEKILETGLSAGRSALQMRAYEEASRYLAHAAAAAGRLDRNVPDLDEALAEAFYRTGRVEAARRHLDAVIRHAADPLQRARAHRRLSDIHLILFRIQDAMGAIEEAFRELGRPIKGRFGRVLGATGSVLLSRIPEGIRHRAPSAPEARERDRLLVDLYLQAALVGYLSLRRDLLVQMRLSAMGPARRLGPSPELVAVHAQHGLLLSTHGRRAAARHLDRAEALAVELDDPAARALVMAARARHASLTGRIRDSDHLSRAALEIHGPWLEPREYVFTAADRIWHLLVRGHAAEAWEWTRRAFAEEGEERANGVVAGHPYLHISALACLAFLGQFQSAAFHLEQVDAILDSGVDPFRDIAFLGHRLILHREAQDLGPPADETLERFERFGMRPSRLPLHLQLVYVAAAYVRIDQAGANSGAGGNGTRHAQLLRAVRDLERAAGSALLAAHAAVARAAVHRLTGRHMRALRLLDRAEALGDAVDAPWVNYEAACERARLLAATGRAAASRRAASVALAIAREAGWRPRVARVRAEFSLPSAERRAQQQLHREPGKDRLDRAFEVSLSPLQGGSPATQARLILDELIGLFGAERALLLRHDPTSRSLELASGRDVRGNALSDVDAFCRRIAERTLLQKAPVSSEPDEDSRHAMAAPLFRRGEIAGVVYVDHHLPDVCFTPADLELLGTIAGHMPLVLESSSLAQLEIYERLAANVPGLVFQMVERADGSRVFRFVSRTIRRLGLEPEEVRQNPDTLLDRIHADDRARFESSLTRAAGVSRPWSWEGRYLMGDGSVRWFYGAARAEPQPGGETYWDGVLVDITRLKRAEEDVRNLNVELEQRVTTRTQELLLANRELEAFTYSVSHDLRAPLLTIQGFAQELVEHVGVGNEAEAFVERIIAAADQMEVLIDAMLSLSRVAHQPLQRRSLDLSEMAEEIIDGLRTRDPERWVETVVEPKIAVEADETLLRIVLENLIGNAWKFTRHRSPARIEVRSRGTDGEQVITVADNGAGFDMSLANRLFQPFERLHGVWEFEGSGVGLATVRRVIQRHGGRVWAEGSRGGGARFHFTLEAAPAGRRGRVRARHAEPPPP
jgi:eukaryotic-like serine/threonine-protein kinase